MPETESNQDRSTIPEGLTLKQSVGGQSGEICQLHWSPEGHFLASVSSDNSIEIWDAENWRPHVELKNVSLCPVNLAWSPDEKTLALVSTNGILLWSLETQALSPWPGLAGNTAFTCVVWSPDGTMLVTGSDDKTVRLWDVATGHLQQTLIRSIHNPCSLAWSPDGQLLAAGTLDGTIFLWSGAMEEPSLLCQGHSEAITCLAWSPNSELLASGSCDRTVRLWSRAGQLKGILEGHTATMRALTFLFDEIQGELLAAKAHYGIVGLWRTDTQEMCRTFKEPYAREQYTSLAFHPSAPCLATTGVDGQRICVWKMELSDMLRGVSSSVLYKNARVIIVGPGGSGKSSLNRALAGLPFDPGMREEEHHIQLLDRHEKVFDDQRKELREIYIWDLDNRSGYRLIHQLYLHGVTVALVVLNTLNEGDPFASAREWQRALQHIEDLKGNAAPRIIKFLLIARADRGTGGINAQRARELAQETGFDGFFVTSATENQRGIAELRQAILAAIAWEQLPTVSSTSIFQKIKEFLLARKPLEQQLSTEGELYEIFIRECIEYMGNLPPEKWRVQFETCIGLLESQGVLRRLNFGEYLLLQPELLDVYASALLDAAREEPEGLGHILETQVRQRAFPIPAKKRMRNSGHESALVSSMIDDFILHDLAIREQTDDDLNQIYLIFPSQTTVENPDLPETEEQFVVFTFAGEVMSVYTSLAVRLSHSKQFRRKTHWKHAIEYLSPNNEVCGIALRIKDALQGAITVFFAKGTSMETRLYFASYIYWHLERRSRLLDTHSALVCPSCGSAFSEQQIQRRRHDEKSTITCPACDTVVQLTARPESFRPVYSPIIPQMDRNAEVQRHQETKQELLQRKKEKRAYDIFFCYNDDSVDRAEVERIRNRLEAEGYLPFVEVHDLQPGQLRIPQIEQQIESIQVAAIFVGKDAEHPPWQQAEIASILEAAIKQKRSVMPVLLPHVQGSPELPAFLKGRVWVDFRNWDPDPLQMLIRGIVGRRNEPQE